MLSMHEQEELDHTFYAASEHQNAYALSMMEQEPDDRAKIESLMAQGFTVTYHLYERYCPFTDALMPSFWRYVRHHDNYDDALIDSLNDDDDETLHIRPYPNLTIEIEPIDLTIYPEEIPF